MTDAKYGASRSISTTGEEFVSTYSLDRRRSLRKLAETVLKPGESLEPWPYYGEVGKMVSRFKILGKTTVSSFRTGYMDHAFDDLASIIDEATETLREYDFDTLVGTGFSGGVVIPALALALGKKFVLIRKEHDDSHHGGGKLCGTLGSRWIFVDDFVSSGATKRRVVSKVEHAAAERKFETTYVGDYTYELSGGFYPSENY